MLLLPLPLPLRLAGYQRQVSIADMRSDPHSLGLSTHMRRGRHDKRPSSAPAGHHGLKRGSASASGHLYFRQYATPTAALVPLLAQYVLHSRCRPASQATNVVGAAFSTQLRRHATRTRQQALRHSIDAVLCTEGARAALATSHPPRPTRVRERTVRHTLAYSLETCS